MNKLVVTYGDKVLLEKDVELSVRQQNRVVDRVASTIKTTEERIADGQAALAKMEAGMTPEQKAERELMQSLPRDEMEANRLMSLRDFAEQRLKQIVK